MDDSLCRSKLVTDGSTSYFQSVLYDSLLDLPNVDVKIVDYNGRMPFVSQLERTFNSDVFIGMHGSGLTHMLFLPDWAAVMEIYNCGDRDCYADLARLRGVKYFTWHSDRENLIYPEDDGKHPHSGGAHKKFTNYRFDATEFKRVVRMVCCFSVVLDDLFAYSSFKRLRIPCGINEKHMVDYVRRHQQFVSEQRKLRRMQMSQDL
uniref:EGF domain-specific O-linked N-acetylglucosamine transferase n=1 Tax=Heterorhabditis bacteriophora TaxID=37862 RepID=A0A1I7WMB1_HETBA